MGPESKGSRTGRRAAAPFGSAGMVDVGVQPAVGGDGGVESFAACGADRVRDGQHDAATGDDPRRDGRRADEHGDGDGEQQVRLTAAAMALTAAHR